jgi:tetratricopeptide (TPR) repeat protein
MEETSEVAERLRQITNERIELERDLQNRNELSDSDRSGFERKYARLQRDLLQLFRQAKVDEDRVTTMLEVMRILENKLVYLQNFIVEPGAETRLLSAAVSKFIDELVRTESNALTNLEATYYGAIAALYSGDIAAARDGFRAACESEESDEANDIKFKSYVILGNLSHEEQDYGTARQMHDKAIQYTSHRNVTAQALAFKALNSYALQDHDEAIRLFEEALTLFTPDEPFFNSYFFRNSLLFCGLIHFERKDYARAEPFYRRILEHVEQDSYDYFDAGARLGKIAYSSGNFEAAAESFSNAIKAHRFTDNEYLVDTYFWLARTYMRLDRRDEARECLQRVTTSEVKYDRRSQALELLKKVS